MALEPDTNTYNADQMEDLGVNCFGESLLENDDDEEDDEKILNMSLIQSIIGSSSSDVPQKGQPLRKVTFRDVSSLGSLDNDDMTNEELVKKIGELHARLTHMSIDMSAEKAMKRKKDKSLVKLAKELNKRAADQKVKEETINTQKNVVADLEAKLTATRSEMDERIAANEKKAKEYNDQLDEAHRKFRAFVAEHDCILTDMTKSHNADSEGLRRALKDSEMEIEQLRLHVGSVREQSDAKAVEAENMVHALKNQVEESQRKSRDTTVEYEQKLSEINKKHENQVDDLRHQLLASKLECDMIRTELASLQMQASPADAANIFDRTMKSASRHNADTAAPSKRIVGLIFHFFRQFVGVIAVLLAFAYPLGLLSMDAICAPVLPGTTLGADDAKFEAPWWINENLKTDAFAICGDRPRTLLNWSGGRLVITEILTSKMLLDKRATSVSIHGNVVTLFTKNARVETLRSPWSM